MNTNNMSKRDYFAAHAPITISDVMDWLNIYGGEVVGPWTTSHVMQTMAELRYAYADAMINERDSLAHTI